MSGRFLAALLLLGTVGCAGIHNGGRGTAPGAVAVDDDGIPVNATPQQREAMLKNRVCTTEPPTGSHIPERVCRFNSNQPAGMPIEEVLRTQSVQEVRGH